MEKGIYAEPVAELALTLAGRHAQSAYARADAWSGPAGRNLIGARAAVSVRRDHRVPPSPARAVRLPRHRGAEPRRRDGGRRRRARADRYVDALPGADLVVLALPLTPEPRHHRPGRTRGSMERHAWLVNVARGKHVVTEDLVWALENGVIGGAGLDVTDPEPLPADHALWRLPSCIITPHRRHTGDGASAALSERIAANVRRWSQGEELIGPIDPELGY
ncbi:MAG: NAD(P)-dependent oxidoreductase [Ilumatobacteraceae bacterium]